MTTPGYPGQGQNSEPGADPWAKQSAPEVPQPAYQPPYQAPPAGQYPPQYPAQYPQQPPYPQQYPPQYPQQPYAYGNFGAPMARATNGMAIASMVLGIVWIYWIGSVLAIIFGFIARSQIRQRNENGGGMATAGIVLGFIGVGIFILLVIVGVASSNSGSSY